MRLLLFVRAHHYPITSVYVCVMVTLIFVLLLTEPSWTKCN